MDRTSIQATIAEKLERIRQRSNDYSVHILALSGGGAGGAFGAGALVGLGRRGERPQYDVVTGVSTGALLAPFAFLGPEWDPQLTEAYTSGRGEHFTLHGVLGLLFGSAARRSAELNVLVDQFITTDLVQAVAREAATTGRLLLVATTDLAQSGRLWATVDQAINRETMALTARAITSTATLEPDCPLLEVPAP